MFRRLFVGVFCAFLGLVVVQGSPSVAVAPVVSSVNIAANSTSDMNVAVPDGMVLDGVRVSVGKVQRDAGGSVVPGVVEVSQGGKRVWSGKPGESGKVAVGKPSIRGVVPFSVSYRVKQASEYACMVVPQSVDVSLTSQLSGVAVAPTTVAGFLSPTVDRVNIVADSSDAGLVGSVLQLTGRVQYAIGDGVRVKVTDSVDNTFLTNGNNVRVVKVSGGDNRVTVDDGARVPTLLISGSNDDLQKSTNAIGQDLLQLASANKVDGLSFSQTSEPSNSLSFQQLGVGALSLKGWGVTSSTVGVNQSQFGSSLSDVNVHVRGTHTVIPQGVTALVNVLWNDTLVYSFPLGEKVAVDETFPIPNELLRAGNGLAFQMVTQPGSGNCQGLVAGNDVQFTINTGSSTVSGTQGNTLAGFDMFPQVFSNTVNVGFGGDTVNPNNTQNAAYLVAALQKVNSMPLTVATVPESEFNETPSLLVVGGDENISNQLRAGLRLTEFRNVNENNTNYQGAVQQPYSAFQANTTTPLVSLLLGGWGANSGTLESRLANYIYWNKDGWRALNANIAYLTTDTKTPTYIETNSVVPQNVKIDEYRSVVWVWVLVGFILLLGTILSLWLRRRKADKQSSDYVDAQEKFAPSATRTYTDEEIEDAAGKQGLQFVKRMRDMAVTKSQKEALQKSEDEIIRSRPIEQAATIIPQSDKPSKKKGKKKNKTVQKKAGKKKQKKSKK